MPIIDISDALYERLGKHAIRFETPESVIDKILNAYEEVKVGKELVPIAAAYDGLDKPRILKIHDELFQFLRERNVIFMPRQKASERLSQGYWFIGDDNYLAISFYTGGDSSNKTPNITFHVYLSDFYLSPMGKSKSAIPLCCIQLSNTPGSVGWETKEPVINEIRNKLIGFECNRFTDGIESRWNRFYEHLDNNGIDYLACLEEFLTKDKLVIDEIIRNAKNPEIGFLDTYKVDRKISVIERISRL